LSGTNDGSAPVHGEKGLDVLDEVQLLVRRGGPEVVSEDHQVFALSFALRVDHSHRGLFAERRIREDHLESVSGVRPERVLYVDRAVCVLRADAMQEHVHHAEPGGVIHDLPTMEGFETKMALLVGIEQVIMRDVVVRRKKEPTSATSRIADRHPRLGTHHFDHGFDQRTGCEVLTRSRLHVLGVLLKQAFVSIAFHVGVQRHPVLAVDQVRDEPFELGRVLDAVLALPENDTDHAGPATEFGEDVPVMDF
jgi:hypothetical protein